MQATAKRIEASKRKTNNRVRKIDVREWRFKRRAFFGNNVKNAASAKGMRTALHVTQDEMAEFYNVTSQAVCNWESGKYAWPGGQDELADYLDACRTIANI